MRSWFFRTPRPQDPKTKYNHLRLSEPAPTRKNPFDRSLVEGPIGPAVWKLAWPTMLQNVIASLQGVVDHVLVGNLLGYTANAAIGVSWQIFLVVIVFMASLFTGQAVLVARRAVAWLAERGYESIGILGTSLGSCLSMLTAAHEPLIKAAALNHISPYFADVVWEGLSTTHVRDGLEGHIEARPARVRPGAIEAGKRRGAPISPNTREWNLLLHRHAPVGAAQHEREVIDRRRDHGIRQRRHNGRPGFARAYARPRRLNFLAALGRDANRVTQLER